MKLVIKSEVLALKQQHWGEKKATNKGEMKLCGKPNYFVWSVFLIFHAYIACVCIYICVYPFSPFYLQLDMLFLKFIKWVKNLN